METDKSKWPGICPKNLLEMYEIAECIVPCEELQKAMEWRKTKFEGQ